MIQGLLYVLIFSNPAFLLSLAASITKHSLPWAVMAVVTWLISIDFKGLSIDLYSVGSGKSTLDQIFARQILSVKNNQTLVEMKEEDYNSWLPDNISKNLWGEKDFFKPYEKLRRSQGFVSEYKKLRIYVREFTEPPFDPLAKSYMSFSGTSFIFMPDFVSKSSSPFQRFKFYHELAHVSTHGLSSYNQKNERILKFGLFFVIVLLCCNLNSFMVYFLCFMLAAELIRWLYHRIDFETKADALAIACIDQNDRAEVLDRCMVVWTSDGFASSFENYIRLDKLKKYIKSLEKNPGKLPFGHAWNHSYGIEGFFYFVFILYISQFMEPISLNIAIGACCIMIAIQIVMRFYISNKVTKIERSLELCISLVKQST